MLGMSRERGVRDGGLHVEREQFSLPEVLLLG